MPEVRVDALTGLRTLLDIDESARAAEANDLLFHVDAAGGERETLAHGKALLDLDVDELVGAVEKWRERMSAHAEAACVLVAADEGEDAELWALPFVPAAVARERERFGAYTAQTMGQNLLEDLVQEEVRRRERLVALDPEAVCVAPYGSRVPYQLLIAPRTPRARFEGDGPTAARLLHDVLGRLARQLEAPVLFDLWVRTAPRGAESFCWRIDVLPRIERPGGLELGTGLHVNGVAPETVAAKLRGA